MAMNDAQRTDLLKDLHRGLTSRNRDFERFYDGDARRVLVGYRSLRSLLRELGRPGVRARAQWTGNPGGLVVAVEDGGLSYRRVMVLATWEVEFLVNEAGAELPLEIPRRGSLP
jgi:hypothetical protein